jgi:hypothetical protein
MASLWGFPFVLLLPLIIVVVLGLAAMRRMRRKQVALREEAVSGQVESLRYQVPVGQDPAAVIAALKQAGYEVVRDDAAMQTQDVIILCPSGADRERAKVRAVIAHDATLNLEGDPAPEHEIRFVDEAGRLGS